MFRLSKRVLRDSLANPLDYPALAESVFSEDTVAILPDAYFSRSPKLLAEIVIYLVENGVDINDICVVLTQKEHQKTAEKLKNLLSETVEGELEVVSHQPDNIDRLGILGVNDRDEPIALNRRVLEADFVITVARYYPRKTLGYFGSHTAIYPRFSDSETQTRYIQTVNDSESRTEAHKSLTKETDHVAKLLGVAFTVQINPRETSPGKRIFSGLPESVRKKFQEESTKSEK